MWADRFKIPILSTTALPKVRQQTAVGFVELRFDQHGIIVAPHYNIT
jgi:hypothetical protein